ncbi:MAG: asparagine synthase-related protein [Bacteroidales bacterium]|nr:asparagine synthase-related protein [Bacteroidales bacterium]
MIQFFGFFGDSLSRFPTVSADSMDSLNSGEVNNQWNKYKDKNLSLYWRWFRQEDSNFQKNNFPVYSDSTVNLIVSSRLDNKSDLGKILGLSVKEPDSRFIAAAYHKWGKKCVDHIAGDWIFVLYDKIEQELFLAKDHFGNTGLFYYKSDCLFAFSSDLRYLLLQNQIPKEINDLFIAKTLVSCPKEGTETAYEEIFRLPPAHYLQVKDRKCKLTRYYFLEKTPLLRYKREEEYFEQFLDLYTKSVKACLQGPGPFASTLSGGLDSGSVSVLAARELAQKGVKLQSYTSVPLYSITGLDWGNRFGDERRFVKRVVDFSGNINVNYINAKEISLISGIKKHLISHAEPGHAAGNYYWILSILKQAQNDGIKTLLTGQGGNGTVSWSGFTESEEMRLLIQQHSFTFSFYKQLIKNLIYRIAPYSVINFYRHCGLEKEPWLSYSAINHSLSDYLELGNKMKKAGHDPHFKTYEAPLKARFRILQAGKTHSGSIWQANGMQYGMEIRDPTRGKELMEFCISVPDRIYRNKNQDRYLMRKSMQGLLPDEVLLNKKRGLQAADNIYRVRAEAAEISAELNSLKKSDLANRFLDISKMEVVFERALRESNREVNGIIGSVLLRGMDTGLFLKDFEEKET